MKTFRQKATLTIGIVTILIGSAYSQTSETLIGKSDSISQQIQTYNRDAVLYRWDTPDLQPIDIDVVRQQKRDSESYLVDLELLGDKLKSNRKELKVLMDQVNVENKKLDNELKMSSQKNKFNREDEKLQKEEKKLRAKELNALKKERNEFKKNSVELDLIQKDIRYKQFSERENKILDADDNWNKRREVLRDKQHLQLQVDTKLEDRKQEIKRRIKELDQQREILDIKEKQLNIEKQQIKLEIKKAKTLIH
ncbi:MAG: hypothetical protein JZU53_06820 [Paludibacter sp.]|nr:hypothetical protein [Paludibacter sp.]